MRCPEQCTDCIAKNHCVKDKKGYCDGYVREEPQEQTNEEWLKSLGTEQLAGFIADVCYGLQDDIWSNCEDTSCDYYQTDKDYWVEWLKEKHET